MAEGVGAPLIGISAYCEQARWGVWEAQAMVLPRRYADRVSAAGGFRCCCRRCRVSRTRLPGWTG